MSHHSKRPLAPKSTGSEENLGPALEQLGVAPRPVESRRRSQGITNIACEPCRRRRSKCDGEKPVCGTCIKKDTTEQCKWESGDHEQRVGNLRARIEELENEIKRLRNQDSEKDASSDGTRGQSQSLSLSDGETGSPGRAGVTSITATLPYHPSRRFVQEDPEDEDDPATSLVQLYSTLAIATQDELSELSLRCRNNEKVASILEAHRQGRLASSTSESTPVHSLGGRSTPSVGALPSGTPFHPHTSSRTDIDYNGPIITVDQDGTRHVWWSRVTNDEKLIQELMEIYFQWIWPIFQHFPRELFLRDYHSGSTDYCCQALVNAVLAVAIQYTSRLEAYSNSNDESTRGTHFLEEARYLACRRLDSKGPIAAAFLVMSHVEFSLGKVDASWNAIGVGTRMTLSHRFSVIRRQRPKDKLPFQLEYHRKVFWAACNLDQMGAWSLGRLSQIPSSGFVADLPEIDSGEDKLPWTYNGHSYAGCYSSSFHHLSRLSKICNLQSQLFYAPTSPLTNKGILSIHDQYKKWFANLPSNLTPAQNAPPHVLALHMYSHGSLLLLFQPFFKATLNGCNVIPSEVCRECAGSIAEIFVHWFELFGTFAIPDLVIQTVRTACVILLCYLPAKSAASHLKNVVVILHKQSPKRLWAEDTLHMIRALSEKFKVQLPTDIEEALKIVASSPGSQPERKISIARRKELVLDNVTGKGDSRQVGNTATVQDMLFSPFPDVGIPIFGPDDMTLETLEEEAGITFGDSAYDPFMGYEYTG